jgi:uncharacterized protein (UPF0276 family)
MFSPLPGGGLPARTGIGLKSKHYQAVLEAAESNAVAAGPAWVEVHPQNYFGDNGQLTGGPPLRWLSAIAAHYPLSLHSVGLSMGSAEGLNAAELEQIALLCERLSPASVSDHLSWCGNAHDRYPDLLPIPYTRESLDHFAAQIGRVQDRLQRRILIENPSRYLSWRDDAMDEVTFLHELCRRSGCGLLFDINNIEVSSVNIGFDAAKYIDAIAPAIVGEIHLAGHTTEEHPSGPLKIDDHGSIVADSCWELFARFIARAGPKPTLIEWDTDTPDLPELMAEVGKADAILDRAAEEPVPHRAQIGLTDALAG